MHIRGEKELERTGRMAFGQLYEKKYARHTYKNIDEAKKVVPLAKKCLEEVIVKKTNKPPVDCTEDHENGTDR